MSFVHLGVRSEYAIVDSIVRIKELVAKASQDGQTSLALADLSNTFALVKFYKACLAHKIKPILGVEVIIGDAIDRTAEDNNFSVILYAMNNTGYQNILQLVSNSYIDRPKNDNGRVAIDTPIVTKSALFTKNDGIIAILTHRSEIAPILNGNYPHRVLEMLSPWQDAFDNRLYLAIKRTHLHDDDYNKNAIIYASQKNIPVIAHNDVRFMNPSLQILGKEETASSDFEAHEARVCITGGYILDDNHRPKLYSEQQYFKSQAEMSALFADIPQVIENTNLLASRCNVQLKLGINVLPDFPIPEGETIESFFKKTAAEGLNARLDKLYPPDTRGNDWQDIKKSYDARLDYEINIILKMGFPGYFLIVMDFIRWAKENGVPVGPGRGSGAGSLVAYSLNITDLDPLKYDLLFERFLNPERVSMPDFDVDFCIEGRDRVIDYVAHTYGRKAVSQIITFGTMAARAVVRDVARVQGKSYGLGDKISKLIPKTPGISLDQAIEEEPQLKDLLTNPDTLDHELALEVWEMAKKLEGITRNVGKHAGGVLIAPNQISDFSAIYCDDEGHFVSQYDKDDVEAVGLVKFDFLGLRNLTVIKAAIDNIDKRRQKEGEAPIDLDTLPLDDKDVYQNVLQSGNTTAVFQLESSGMKKYLKQLKPTNIEDVIAMCALYRPGPLESGMVSDFIDRKHGIQEVAYPDPNFQHASLQPALHSTYGVIVYQEQVMQIAQVLAGYTLGGADMLRRAMGKKKPEEMAKQREVFVQGAISQHIDGDLAAKIFDLVEKFAGYGFNKSHSAAYGVLAYQTAYLKYYYPAEFMAAVLTSEMSDTDAVVFLINDCKENFGLTVLPPSVNRSQWQFIADDPQTIIYGLGAVKGVGIDAVASIVQARKDGEFQDLYDFCNRVDTKKVGKLALEALILAGCFDDLAYKLAPHLQNLDGKNQNYQIRGGLWEQLPKAMEVANQNRENKNNGTLDLFAEVDDGLSVAPPLASIIWSSKERLAGENAKLGLYLTGHPMDEYRQELKNYTTTASLAQLSDTGFKDVSKVAGLIVDVANFGNRVAITLDDGTYRREISCYLEQFNRLKHLFKIGEIIIVKLTARESDGRLFATLRYAYSLLECRLNHLTALHIKIHSQDTQKMTELFRLLKENNPPSSEFLTTINKDDSFNNADNLSVSDGCLPVFIYLYDDCATCGIQVNTRFRIHPNEENISALKATFEQHLILK